ncbi:HXXEE domain-containing protein [Sphingobacterium lactis]|uniref:HXXEE domain-containing protein n=1 Tax=Sphingobacterium lactis TaxID=797291 RepID=UPI003DA5C7E2
MELKILVLIFPIIFMIHDFEEIIFFKKWILRNENELTRRFPKIANKLLPHFKNISTSSFALGVAEEFLIVSIISVFAIMNEDFKLWYGIFIGFFIHIIIHIIQWIIYRKYIPSIVTSFLVLPHCFYTLEKLNESKLLELNDKILWGVIGFVIVILNLLLVHKLIAIFEKLQQIKDQ